MSLTSYVRTVVVAGVLLDGSSSPLSGQPITATLSSSSPQVLYEGPAGRYVAPTALAFDPTRDLLYVADKYRVRSYNVVSGEMARIAGDGTNNTSGDGGLATAAQVNNVQGLAVDPATGDLYLAEADGGVIRKVAHGTGIITTYAGTVGATGYTGDGGAATSATMNGPYGLSLATNGDLYCAEAGNNVVRLIQSGGTILTVAGTGVAGFSGDGGHANLAQLSFPMAVLVIPGTDDYYIADCNNNVIRAVTASGDDIETIAGGASGFSGDGAAATSAAIAAHVPQLARSADGTILYWVEQENHCVRSLTFGDGFIHTVAGRGASDPGNGGLASAAVLHAPQGLLFVGTSLYVSEAATGWWGVRTFTPSGTISPVLGDQLQGYAGDGMVSGQGDTISTAPIATLSAGAAPLTAPTAAQVSGGGALPAGAVQYGVATTTLTNGVVIECAMSALSTVITVAANDSVALTAIPLGAAGTTGRVLYRKSGGNPPLQLATIANNTATTYTDTASDASIAANLPPLPPLPLGGWRLILIAPADMDAADARWTFRQGNTSPVTTTSGRFAWSPSVLALTATYGSSAAPAPTTVLMFIYDLGGDGSPVVGTQVKVAPTGSYIDNLGNSILPSASQTKNTDSNGYAAFFLIPTSLLSPSGASYTITQSSGTSTFTVPPTVPPGGAKINDYKVAPPAPGNAVGNLDLPGWLAAAHIGGRGVAPVLTLDAHAGTGRSISTPLAGNDQAGTLGWTAGTAGWATGTQAVITFTNPYTRIDAVVLTGLSAQALIDLTSVSGALPNLRWGTTVVNGKITALTLTLAAADTAAVVRNVQYLISGQ